MSKFLIVFFIFFNSLHATCIEIPCQLSIQGAVKTFENSSEDINHPKTISIETFKFQESSSNFCQIKESQQTPIVKLQMGTPDKKDIIFCSDAKSSL